MSTDIHPTAIIHNGAEIGERTKIGAFSIIGGMTKIGADCVVGANCELGIESGVSQPATLVISDNSLIRSGSIFYQGSEFGPGLKTGHRVVVRERVKAGLDLQIGTLCDLQGHCVIGDYVRLHSNVHIGQKSTIGNFVWIFPYVVLTNDPTPPSDTLDGCVIEDFSVIATMTTVLPGCRVQSGGLVGAMSLVREDVPKDSICVGIPGRIVGPTNKVKFKASGMPVYPWRRHFHRGYPEHVVQNWKREFPDG